MEEELNDASNDSNAEEHLPSAGEFQASHVPEDGNITEIDDEDEYPDEPAIPHVSGDQSYQLFRDILDVCSGHCVVKRFSPFGSKKVYRVDGKNNIGNE